MMDKFQTIQIVQIVSAVLMIALILLQQRGGGLSGVFGGTEAAYSSRRGVEKYIFRGTIVLAIIFLVSAVLQIILR